MKLHRRRWRDNEARLKEARRVSWLHKRGLTRRSTMAEVFAATLHFNSQRKGFARRFLERTLGLTTHDVVPELVKFDPNEPVAPIEAVIKNPIVLSHPYYLYPPNH